MSEVLFANTLKVLLFKIDETVFSVDSEYVVKVITDHSLITLNELCIINKNLPTQKQKRNVLLKLNIGGKFFVLPVDKVLSIINVTQEEIVKNIDGQEEIKLDQEKVIFININNLIGVGGKYD